MSTLEDHDTTPPGSQPVRGVTWRKLASWAAFAIPIIFVVLMVAYMEFIPFFLPFIVVFALVGWWVGRGGKASAIVLAVLALLFIAMNAPFIIPTLAVPASAIDFISTAWLLLAAITAVVAGIMAFRAVDSSEGPRAFLRVVAGVGVAALVVSLALSLSYDDAERRDGDIAMTAENIEFQPDEVEGDSGTVAVFVTNNDPTLHTFTIDELDVSLDIPANSTARIEFDADAGEYEFYCIPHEADMKGTLEVR